ncbi:hypothetical protein chiPu_0011222 [Chiloscyllium punctatum]|uniref:Uncharacterized protein n=1 Tax=Chiloscyllium punctatum TaxID=137246 RepID=A0A401SQU6_CHIPU|nr:hypothetical protein [Chiloscyllium punctatum]
MSKVLTCKPCSSEGPEDFLVRFKDYYGAYSGDAQYPQGHLPQFNALCMTVLPDQGQKAIMTQNMHWQDADVEQFSWELKDPDRKASVVKVKTEFAQTAVARPKTELQIDLPIARPAGLSNGTIILSSSMARQ